MLLHSLEQCRLHLGGCAVDFVGKDEVGKDRSLLHMELLVFLRIHHRAHDIGRQEVGCKLYAAEIGIDEL